ncbi:ESX secretion-associated protein EspG [Nocardia sp. NPDC050710]|uniref:ESX secretion-associated protein EspG n=1 Tax=Nocardia sp. NPDC050710 TaxID=3157220 RepID=UPI00340AC0E3
MATWSLDPEEFAALWFGPANDRMLHPLTYLSRFTHVNERDEYWTRVRHEWSDRGRLDWDESDLLTRTFAVLTEPEAWVEVHGSCEGVGPIRIAAARHDRHAAVAVQFTKRPRIDVSIISAENLPTALAKLLPDRPPGQRGPETFHTDDLDPTKQPIVRYTNDSTPLERYRRLLDLPGSGAGLITVLRGPRYSTSAPPRRIGTVRWFDTRDGRYLETGSSNRTVRPATISTLRDALTRMLDHAINEYREYTDELGEFAR